MSSASKRHFAIALLAVGAVAAVLAQTDQTTQPTALDTGINAPTAKQELPATVVEALSTIEDFSFSFSQPGFYALLAHLKATTAPPGHTAGATEINDWNVLLERPAEFRGRAITIEGTVGRNSSWQLQQEPYREFGTVTQLELTQPDQVIAATVILTNPAGDIPIGNRVRITGYFVMIRQYYSASKRLCQAALFVAHGPTEVSEVVAIPQTKPLSSTLLGLAIAFFAAMIVVWFLLRKNTMAGRRGSGELHASRAAPFSVADDLEKWAGEDDDASNEPSAEDDESQC